MTKRLKVYIAGPYTQGDVETNIKNAVLAAQEVYDAGHVPYVPHLNHLWHDIVPGSYEQWMDMDFEWLGVCDVMVRLPGESPGADREAAFARGAEIPVYDGVKGLLGVWSLPDARMTRSSRAPSR